jgi:hypothetical protein
MHGHTSLWALAREQQTYTELLAGLCAFHEIDLVDGPRGRMVRDADCQIVRDLLYAWRSRPKLSYLSGKTRRRKPAHMRAPKLKRLRRRYGPKPSAA